MFGLPSPKRALGTPWTLLNVSDVITIGLMAILFMFLFHVIAAGWSQMSLWRVTGSPTVPQGSPGDINLADPTLTTVEAT